MANYRLFLLFLLNCSSYFTEDLCLGDFFMRYVGLWLGGFEKNRTKPDQSFPSRNDFSLKNKT